MRQAPEGRSRGRNHLDSSQLKELAFSQEGEAENGNLFAAYR